MKQITFKQYKAIDLAILTALLFVFELVAVLIFESRPLYIRIQDIDNTTVKMPFVMSITLTHLIMIITMMRWDVFAFIPAIAGGVAYCLGGGGSFDHYIVYCIGNLFGLISIFIIKKIGKEKIRDKILNIVIVAVSTYLFIVIGRWLVSLIFEPSISNLLFFVTTDLVSLLVCIFGLIAIRKSDGMLEDQKAYLLRLDRERREDEEKRAKQATEGYYMGNVDEDDELDDLDDGIIYEDDLEYGAPSEEEPADDVKDDYEGEIEPHQNKENNEEIISEDKI